MSFLAPGLQLRCARLSSILCVHFTVTPPSSQSLFWPPPPLCVTLEFRPSWLPPSPCPLLTNSVNVAPDPQKVVTKMAPVEQLH